MIWGNAYTMDEFCTLSWERSCWSSHCSYCLGWAVGGGAGVLRSLKTSKSSASKWSSERLNYYSSKFNSYKIDENTECLGSINLARFSSGMKLVGGRGKESNGVLLTEGFTLVNARFGGGGCGVQGWFILLQMETPSVKRYPFKKWQGSGSVLQFLI